MRVSISNATSLSDDEITINSRKMAAVKINSSISAKHSPKHRLLPGWN